MLKSRVTRLRRLEPAQARRLELLRGLSTLLDSAFEVPGTSYRVGLDPIIGIVPLVGDLVSPLFTMAVLWQSRDLGVPRVVQLRMLFNAAIDALLGAVPVVGDLFDFTWKSNLMNLALLERHAHEEHAGKAGDWMFVSLLILLIALVAVIPLLIVGWLSASLWRHIA